MSANPTREKLLAAAADTLRHEGMSGLAARPIAARAGVNQALIFYHFDSVAGLVDAAVRTGVDVSLADYRQRFAAIGSLTELLTMGRDLHAAERDNGNVAMMAHLMAGAQHDEVLAAAARYAVGVWIAEIEVVVRRVLVGNPLADVVDPVGLTRAIVAGFLGLELFEGVDPSGAASALDSLEALGVVVEMVDDLGPVARRALSAVIRRRRQRGRRRATPGTAAPRGR